MSENSKNNHFKNNTIHFNSIHSVCGVTEVDIQRCPMVQTYHKGWLPLVNLANYQDDT